MSRGRKHVLASLGIFAVAFTLRRYYFSGLVLGDDGQEYAVVTYILHRGRVMLTDQLHLRFGWWVPNYLSFLFFGVSETTFMLAQWVTSSTLGVIAYAILVSLGYGVGQAFLGGLFVCSAPFEVLIGTTHANDLYLGWAFAVGLLLLIRLEGRPVLQGVSLALCFWYAFYTKIWAVYALPALGLYYVGGRRWRGLGSFLAASVLIHGLTCAYWKIRLGTFVPFIETHAANWPVPREQLPFVLRQYPDMILKGTELGTTLFGAVPYLVIGLLVLKALVSLLPRRFVSPLRFDRADATLAVLYGSFFLLLNFFPNGFHLDHYYSVPRIFRYLTPISFPMALHVAKMFLDVSRVRIGIPWPSLVATALFVPLLALNVYETDEAMRPGQIYRAAFMSVLRDVRALKPPRLVADALIASWARDLYLEQRDGIEVNILAQTYKPEEYEKWIREHEDTLPEGTMLITGLANYPYYGAHGDGPLVWSFSAPLEPRWEIVKEYGLLTYLYRPERARLWRLTRAGADHAPPPESLSGEAPIGNSETLFRAGMERLNKNDNPGARVYFRRIVQNYPDRADDARFYSAVSFFREPDCRRSIKEFKRLLKVDPRGHWTPSAHLLIADCDRRLGNLAHARTRLRYLIAHFPPSATTDDARMLLNTINFREGGILTRFAIFDR